jgi:hypothetical protein
MEEHRLRVFENRVLRIFGPKRDEAIGGWRKLHNEELHNLYGSPSKIRMIKLGRMRWAGYVARMGEKRNAYRISVGKPERKRPLGKPRRRWGITLQEFLGRNKLRNFLDRTPTAFKMTCPTLLLLLRVYSLQR